MNCKPTGRFAHNPEPIPENLTQISEKIKECGADLGIVVDPDVDCLALVLQNGDVVSIHAGSGCRLRVETYSGKYRF